MCPLTCLAQIKHGAPGNHITAVPDKGFQALFQIQQLRATINQRHHVNTKDILQLGVLIKVIQHNFGDFAALEVYHHAHAVLVRLIAQS